MSRVLLTGATGFVASTLGPLLRDAGYEVRVALRGDRATPAWAAGATVVGDIGSHTDWSAALAGVDAVIHLAARVHVMHDSSAATDAYVETNARGTQRLADHAARAGVRRFIFSSSVKVNGEESGERPYTATDEPAPRDAYGASKWLAEQHLTDIARQTRLEIAVIRCPLVYGPGVRANFWRLMSWIDRGRPLPFGAIHNRRSLVSVWNLSDLILRLLQSPVGSARVWMAADGEDLSTPDLIRRLARAMNRQARLLPIPPGWLYALGAMTGRAPEVARLCGSLTVDIGPAREQLGWSPPMNVNEALSRTVAWYLAERMRSAS